MKSYNTTSPVIFCIFNRPDTTLRVFNEIAKARPPALYIVADAARPNVRGEDALCQQTRIITEKIDWPCEVIRDYAPINLGCKQRIYSGITNAFKQFDFAIILEDDCLPSPDFFRFIDTMRDRYQDDSQVMQIGGSAFVRTSQLKDAYYRSAYPLIWGWATWKRAWEDFDLSMPAWPKTKKELEQNPIGKPELHARFLRQIEKTYQGKVNTWDYPFVAHILSKHGHCITPHYNLISNIGFGKAATHAKNDKNPLANIPFDPLPNHIAKLDSQTIDKKKSGTQLNNGLYRRNSIEKRIHKFSCWLGFQK
jgi:hypothetical protein